MAQRASDLISCYVITPETTAELFQIWLYIAKDSEEIADRVQSKFFSIFNSLAMQPGQGHRRRDYTKADVLFFPLYSYLIVYRPATDPLQILAIVHGAREIKRLLKQRGL